MFEFSDRAKQYQTDLLEFMDSRVYPAELVYAEQMRESGNPHFHPPILEELKAEARSRGLWNLFHPHAEWGPGLSNLDYAPLAEIMGHSHLASEACNCSAPDTGNMEVFTLFGTEEHKEKYLKPLLAGEIRSAFAMTEPDVASSDATNMQATIAEDGDALVLNGRKWWATGLGHPAARLAIFMGLSNPEAAPHARHSMVLVPLATPGVNIQRMLPAFSDYDPPYGHGEVWFENVRVPRANLLRGLGDGFAIAQGRLGPGRIHHCMRCIGAAERALELLIKRGLSRTAFGKPLLHLGGNLERVADLRMAIDQARLLTLFAAWKIDNQGVKAAMNEISAIKVVAPSVLQRVVDEAIQIHGGAGVSHDVPLTALFTVARALRLADGPDEVHRAMVARVELAKYKAKRE